jgi:hypothetical protein
MMYCCCLCDATGKLKAGHVRPGYGVPLCAEHFAQGYWRARQPKPPSAIVSAPSPEQAYQDAIGRAVLIRMAN